MLKSIHPNNNRRTPKRRVRAYQPENVMSMSKKSYIVIAAVLRDQISLHSTDERQQALNQGVRCIAQDLAKVFAKDSPNFDPARFLTACGVAA